MNIAGRYVEGEGEDETSLVTVGYRLGKFRSSLEFGTRTTFAGVDTDVTTFGVTYAGPVLVFAQIGEFERGEEDFSAPLVGVRMKF